MNGEKTGCLAVTYAKMFAPGTDFQNRIMNLDSNPFQIPFIKQRKNGKIQTPRN
jgi:hypothetical protein